MTQLSLFPNKRENDPYRLTPEKRDAFEKARVVGFDIETSNDLNRIPDDLVREFFAKGKFGISFLTQMVYLGLWCDDVPYGVVLDEEEIRSPEIMDWVRSLFAKENITFVAHNIVFDLRLLAGRYDIPIPKRVWDTYSNEIIFGDADPGYGFGSSDTKQFNLLSLLREYGIVGRSNPDVLRAAIGIAINWEPALTQIDSVLKTWREEGDEEDFENAYLAVHKRLKSFRADITALPVSVACAYTALDTMMTVLLMRQQVRRMKEEQEDYPHIFQITDFENRFNRLCASMGAVGIPVNQTYLKEKMQEWERELVASSRRMYEFCVSQIISKAFNGDVPEDALQLMDSEDKGVLSRLSDIEDDLEIERRVDMFWDTIKTKGTEYVAALRYLRKNGFTPTKPYDQQIYLFLACGIKMPVKNASNAFLWTGTGKTSTGKAAMQWYFERYGELLEDFLAYRANVKRLEKAQELLMHSWFDNRVHSMIVTRTVTGRTSSSDPNLQNMRMREEWGLDEEGEDVLLDANFTGVLTSVPGYVLLGIDISNAETYMGAMMAKDDLQMKALYSGDYHSQMTMSYFPTLAKQAWEHKEAGNEGFWKALRSASKAVTFGTAYGMGALKLARNPQLSEAIKPREGQIEELHQDRRTVEWFVSQGILPDSVFDYSNQRVYPERAMREDWEFAVKVWNAQKILAEKDRAFPDTTIAKEMAEQFAARHGYAEMWSGRHVFVREARKAWNAICQGGVAELTKRWAVLVHEFLEENDWLDAQIVNYVHDELVIHCPIPFAEYISKTAVKLIEDVIETQPVDKSGKHWFDRTNPRGGFYAGVEHKENSHKWGKFVYREYPFDTKLSWDETNDEELHALREMVLDPAYRYNAFCKRRFFVPKAAGAGMGEEGLDLRGYVEYLEYQTTVGRSWESREILDKLEVLACSLQEQLGLKPLGLIGAIQDGL